MSDIGTLEKQDIIGSTIGRYTILGKIGAGGMAEVFLARSKGAGGIDKTLVIKKIHPVLAQNERFISMFMEEARVAMRLNHSNIVQVYAFEKIDKDYVLAMEHVDGSDLLDIQTLAYHEGKRIPFGLCAFIISEVAKGLDYSHNRKDDNGEPLELVHRDVSPQNILISKTGGVKVTDFGIVKAKSMDEEIGEVKGKLGYMSPQQARGLIVDKRADIFSLGVVLHELLVGATKDRPKIGEIIELDPPISINQLIPKKLNNITMKALEEDPAKRYQTAREMVIDINSYLRTQQEIFDTTTLEEWIEKNIPNEKLEKVHLEDGFDTGATTAIYNEQTINLRTIGEFEQQASVMIAVQIDLDETRESRYLLNEFNRLTQEMAYKNGVISRITIEKTRVFLGLPKSVFEDSIKGVRFAIDLMDVINILSKDHKKDIPAKISINRGLVKTSKEIDGRPLMFEPEPEMEQMSQLLLNACMTGQIIVGQGVVDIARNDYHFSDSVILDDQSTDVTKDGDLKNGYHVLGVKSRVDRNISSQERVDAFFGRDKDLQILINKLNDTKKGKPALIKLTGELGLGKSSVVRELVNNAKREGFKILRNECLFVEKDMALTSAAATIRTILESDDDLDDNGLYKSLDYLLREVPQYKERQYIFFKELLVAPVAFWENHPQNRRHLILKIAFAIGVMLAKISSKKPILLIIDNAHWIDGPSVDVLSELARALIDIPVFVILAGQPETLSYRMIENLESLELKELSDSDMAKLIAARIGDNLAVRGVSEQILERAHGNPFFANEIINSLISKGILVQEESDDGKIEYRPDKPGVIYMPPTVQGIAESRINTLDNSSRMVLRTSAVIGSSASQKILETLIGRDVSEDLKVLTDRSFLVPYTKIDKHQQKSSILYHFKRSIEREAAYAGLPASDCKQFHAKLARILMKDSDDELLSSPVQIAWHLDKSDQFNLAARYYLEAADAAMKVYSPRRAYRLIERALAIIPLGTKERYDALLTKERIIRDIGLHDIHLDTLKEIEDLANRFDDFRMQASTAYRYSRYWYYEGDFEQAAAMVNRAIIFAKQAGSKSIMVESLRELGYLSIEEGRLQEAYECAQKGESIISDAPEDAYLKARVMGLKGLVLMEMGNLKLAAYPLVFSMIIFKKLNDKRNESVQLANIGLLAQARGFLMEGLSFIEHALSIDKEIKDVSERGRKLVSYADIRIELGQFNEGEKILNDAIKVSQKNYEPFGELEGELGMADLLLQKKEIQLAKELLDNIKSRKYIERSSTSVVRYIRLKAELYIALKQWDKCVSTSEEAIEIATKSKMESEVVHGLSLYALSLSFTENSVSAIDECIKIENLMNKLGLVINGEKIWWRAALVMHKLKDFDTRDRFYALSKKEIDRKLSFIEDNKHKALFMQHPFIEEILQGNFNL
ncbi:MAG: protein kinase [Deltaproteobacteria bacterium]|nr:protein kinase [Deltaproteobacteria bacterium]